MGTVLASKIISDAQTLLQDADGTRWTSEELLGWLNEGQREIVLAKPDAYVKAEAIRLAAGVRQALPVSGTVLLAVTRNMGADGLTPGAAVPLVDRAIMDAALPGWAFDATSTVVGNYMYDDRSPKHFYVHPPQPAANQGYVEVVYSAAPADVGAGAAILLDDVYAGALINYMIYRAYSKDLDMGPNAQRASLAYSVFSQALGNMQTQETTAEPVAKSMTGPFVSVTRAG